MLSQASRSQPGCAQVRRKLSNQAAIQLLRKSSARELRQSTLQAIIHHEAHARPLPAYSRLQAVCDLALCPRARATIVSRAFDHAGKCRIVAFDNARANEDAAIGPSFTARRPLIARTSCLLTSAPGRQRATNGMSPNADQTRDEGW